MKYLIIYSVKIVFTITSLLIKLNTILKKSYLLQLVTLLCVHVCVVRERERENNYNLMNQNRLLFSHFK